jgi:2,4-dienoyl-CoA reductase-like NADH-dependent reductase (Old Yellow Enzyme family)
MGASPFEPARLGPLMLRNRLIKAATFEGRMPKGAVTDELVEFHARVAAGGAAMTTVAYCAVNPSGRVHRHTLVLDRDALPGLRRLVEEVHRHGAAAAAHVAVTAKFNMADGVPKGLWLDESLPFARMLEADGHLDAIELTAGSSLLNGMYYFRGDVPMRELIATQPKLVGLALRLAGRRIFPSLPFEEAFLLPFARQFRATLDLPLILLGGVNRLDTIQSAIDEGFEFVAMARALLREPDLPNRLAAGTTREGLCVHCNKCLPTIYTGTECVLAEDRHP